MADELGGVSGGGMYVDFTGTPDLFKGPVAQEGDAGGQGHCFFLVVGDEQEGDADFALQNFEFGLHLLAEVGVESRERFVEEEKLWTIYERSGQGDALLLAATQFGGPGARVFGHFHHSESFVHTRGDFAGGRVFYAKAVGHVFADAEVGKKCVMLEDRVYRALVGGEGVEADLRHPDFTRRGLFEPGDETEESGFAGAAFSEER